MRSAAASFGKRTVRFRRRTRNNLSGFSRGGVAATAADQALSSATNFGTTLVAARLLGVSGLGEVAVCLAVAYAAVAVSRALVGEPTLVLGGKASAAGPISLAVLVGLSASACVLLAALVLPTTLQNSLLVLAFVLPVVLLQDAARYVFFSEARPRDALKSDSGWALAQIVSVAGVYVIGATPPMLIAAWGAGAAAGAAVALDTLRVVPRPQPALAWLRSSKNVSGWLGLQVAVSQAAMQVSQIFLVAVIGKTGVGAVRASQTVFAPLFLTLSLAPLLALPRMRGGTSSIRRGVAIAAAGCGAAAAGYAGLAIVGGGELLGAVFGSGFEAYADLLAPFGIAAAAQALATAPGLGSRSLLAGRAIALTQLVAVMVGLPAVLMLAFYAGVEGAAWGFAIQSVTLMVASWVTYRRALRSER